MTVSNKQTYTPGPWATFDDGDGIQIMRAEDVPEGWHGAEYMDRVIATVRSCKEEWENAYGIAAVPDLIEAATTVAQYQANLGAAVAILAQSSLAADAPSLVSDLRGLADALPALRLALIKAGAM